DRLYSLPDPCETAAEYYRYYNLDLVDMPEGALASECRGVQFRIDLEDRPPLWLLERLEFATQMLSHKRQASMAHLRDSHRAARVGAASTQAGGVLQTPRRRQTVSVRVPRGVVSPYRIEER